LVGLRCCITSVAVAVGESCWLGQAPLYPSGSCAACDQMHGIVEFGVHKPHVAGCAITGLILTKQLTKIEPHIAITLRVETVCFVNAVASSQLYSTSWKNKS